jgi:serine/threonine-protein kinase
MTRRAPPWDGSTTGRPADAGGNERPIAHYRRLGKYELHELIGEGAMGVVWRAYDSVLRRFVALKLLGSSFAKTLDARDRFLREARAAGALQHPNIVTVYDLGEAENQLFIAMELLEGQDLSSLIASREPLALERKLDIIVEMLQGLSYAHERGVIHRDIKPSNVRLTTDGRVKIMDFGIARLQSAEQSSPGAIVGTPSHMAPEQITNGPITPATDLFAVGCLLYELLGYHKPFEGESVHGVLYQVLTMEPKPLRTMAPSIPAALERVVAKAMSKAPDDRYATAKQMQLSIAGIRAALSGATDHTTQRLGARWTPLPNAALRLVTHVPTRWRLAVLALLAGVAGLLLYLSFGLPEPAAPPGPVTRRAPQSPPSPGAATGPDRQLLATLNPALAARRDSALAARTRAAAVGAAKNSVPAVVVADAMLEAADRELANGDQARAMNGYVAAVAQYERALREAETLEQVARRAIDRATPVVRAIPTGAEAARAGGFLARAESLYRSMDYDLARNAALSAEEVGVAVGVAPPSPQPANARAAIEVLLADLARAIASERVANLRVLSPAMTAQDQRAWTEFFRSARRLRAEFTIQSLRARGTSATATVRSVYRYVEAQNGPPQELLQRLEMRFTRTNAGWRIAGMEEMR